MLHRDFLMGTRVFGSDIMRDVARRHGMTVEEMTRKSMKRRFAWARQHAMYEMRQYTKLSYPQIARLLNIGDHTTVIFGVRAHAKRLADTAPYGSVVAVLSTQDQRS
jgi:chromosomal replication initiation ATPase DnaA